jgi:hypothetical protein
MTRRGKTKSEAQQVVDRTRAMHAYSFFVNLTMTAKQQINLVDWQRLGGLEAEETLDAWLHGRPSPFFDDYAGRKLPGGHPGPCLRVRHFQRLAVLLSVALQRTNMKKGEARQQIAKALSGPALLGEVTAKKVEHWELEQPLPSEQDEEAIRRALVSCGADRQALVRYFLGAVRLPWFIQFPWA